MIGLSKQSPDTEVSTIYSENHNYKLGLMIAAGATLGGSIIGVTSRMLKELNFAVIQFVYSLTSSVLMGICVGVARYSTNPENGLFHYDAWSTYGEILMICVLNMICQNMFTYANQNSNPTTVGLMIYMGIFYSFLLDHFAFKISFPPLELAGVFVCLACCMAVAVYKHRQSKSELQNKDTK